MDGKEQQAEHVWEDARRRQRHLRGPQRFADILSNLMAKRGYAQQQSAEDCAEAWREAVGQKLANHSRVGNLRRGVLEVTVRNSTVLQELSFQQQPLLAKLERLIPDHRIRQLRFRVGSID